jgi:hypothetical protein
MIIKQFSVYHLFTGHIGKKYVIKHRNGKVIKTKYPDRSNVIFSSRQKACQQRFANAVAHAQSIMKDDALRTEWEQRTRKIKNKLRGHLISLHMKAAKEKALQAMIASGKCITYDQVQVLPFQGRALTRGSKEWLKKETKRTRKLKPLSRATDANTPQKRTSTKRKTWIRKTKKGITFRHPVAKEAIYQFFMGILSMMLFRHF